MSASANVRRIDDVVVSVAADCCGESEVTQHPRVPGANKSEDRPLVGTGVSCPVGVAGVEGFELG